MTVHCHKTVTQEIGKGGPKNLTMMICCHKTVIGDMLCRLTVSHQNLPM